MLSGATAKKELGVKTLDIAKRLLDYGFHPPTVYFPLLVDEALMVEPTETETKETLDAFADAVDQILAEAEEDAEIARQRSLHDPGAPPRRGQGDEEASGTAIHIVQSSRLLRLSKSRNYSPVPKSVASIFADGPCAATCPSSGSIGRPASTQAVMPPARL